MKLLFQNWLQILVHWNCHQLMGELLQILCTHVVYAWNLADIQRLLMQLPNLLFLLLLNSLLQHVFKMDQEEYTKEAIDWSYIEFVDNQDVLDLIEKKPGGIISLLDEACMFPKSTHETFAQKMYQTYPKHKRFIKPKLSRTSFTIAHYAGEVTYLADQFLDKNKDYVVAEHQDLLTASKCSFVVGLFPPLPVESSKSSKFSSIGSRFKAEKAKFEELEKLKEAEESKDDPADSDAENDDEAEVEDEEESADENDVKDEL